MWLGWFDVYGLELLFVVCGVIFNSYVFVIYVVLFGEGVVFGWLLFVDEFVVCG